ncbi:MAG: hypothetical protein ACK56G_19625 [Pirellulaceae bacterium]
MKPAGGEILMASIQGTGGGIVMWRPFFIGLGLAMAIAGVQCLVVDSATFASAPGQPAPSSGSLFGGSQATLAPPQTFKPKEWMPWGLIFSGAVVILYSRKLNRL